MPAVSAKDANAPIELYNRYTNEKEQEKVYFERSIKFFYGTFVGRLGTRVLSKAFLSKYHGKRMKRPASQRLVEPFIKQYNVDRTEFVDDNFASFNDFFCRKLKLECHPLAGDESVAVFPADGRHLGYQDISKMEGIFVKGQVFSLEQLLGSAELAARFRHGSMVLSRLCPVDYHRYHFPVSGTCSTPRVINGPLFAVNPFAVRRNIHILAQNKRAISFLESPVFGTVITLEVGATAVGSMCYTFAEGAVERGQEKGYFEFGGSQVITLFEPGRVRLDDDLLSHSSARRELYAHVRDRMGVATNARISAV